MGYVPSPRSTFDKVLYLVTYTVGCLGIIILLIFLAIGKYRIQENWMRQIIHEEIPSRREQNPLVPVRPSE